MQRRTKRVLAWGCGILALGLLIAGALVVTLAVQFAGGWDEVLDLARPEEQDPEVVAARAEANAALDAQVDLLVSELARSSLAGSRVVEPEPEGGTVDLTEADTSGSGCEVGQHNWKVDVDYDLLCFETRSVVLASSRADARPELLALDRALRAEGWESHGSGLDDTVADYLEPGTDPDDLPSAQYTNSALPGQLDIRFGPGWDTDDVPAVEDSELAITLRLTVESFRA